jgi:hypothetical protein
MISQYDWKQMRVIALYLTPHEARLLSAALRQGQNKLADEVKAILKAAKE